MSKNFFATTPGIIVVGAVIGALAICLQQLGNPGNMGICIACFERDTAGGLGLHRAAVVQYLRPEIMGLVLGALVASFAAGEFKPRGGSAPLVRFVLGIVAAMGALVFLGCPWRTILRLAGGRRATPSSALPVFLSAFSAAHFSSVRATPSAEAQDRAVWPVLFSPCWCSACSLSISSSRRSKGSLRAVHLLLPQGSRFQARALPGLLRPRSDHRHSGAAQPFLHHGRLP